MKKAFLILLLFIITIFKSYSQKVIQMEYDNGVYYVPCKVNGIDMKFVFDTGASDVSISLTEAKFLIKQGLLKDTDIKESVKYQIANGEVQEGTKIIIREINIDGIILKNVEASIVHQLNAPLLLGQSAINKLGKIKLDGNLLIVESKYKDENYYTHFLNVDVFKTLLEYDFNTVAPNIDKLLRSDNLPVNEEGIIDIVFPLKMFNNGYKHFINDFNFEKQVVRFKKNKSLHGILLSKKSNNINIEFNKLSERISNIYGELTEYGQETSTWKNKFFSIYLIKDEDGTLAVVVEIKENKDVLIKKIRTMFVELATISFELYDADRFEEGNSLIRFSRVEGDNVAIHIQSNLAINKNKLTKREVDVWVKTLCFSSAEILLKHGGKKEFLEEAKFENIIFNIELTYNHVDRVKVKKKISKKDLKELHIPFTVGELTDILSDM